MALLFSWLNLGVCSLLVVASIALWLDAKGERRARRAAELALQTRTAAHDRTLAELRSALAHAGERPPAPAPPALPERVARDVIRSPLDRRRAAWERPSGASPIFTPAYTNGPPLEGDALEAARASQLTLAIRLGPRKRIAAPPPAPASDEEDAAPERGRV